MRTAATPVRSRAAAVKRVTDLARRRRRMISRAWKRMGTRIVTEAGIRDLHPPESASHNRHVGRSIDT